VLKHCAANKKRWLSALPNVVHTYTTLKFLALQGAPYIYIYICIHTLIPNKDLVHLCAGSPVGRYFTPVLHWPWRTAKDQPPKLITSITLRSADGAILYCYHGKASYKTLLYRDRLNFYVYKICLNPLLSLYRPMSVSGQSQHELWTRTDDDRTITGRMICCSVLIPIRCHCW
jgi:hypothetical protein